MDNGACSYRRFLDGDEAAFDEIMKELFEKLVFFINRYVQDIHTAEDIAIDTFSELVVHKSRYNFKVTLKTYLFMIGRSRALNHIKHKKIIKFVDISNAQNVKDQNTLLDIVLKDENKRAVNCALEKLPDSMREAVHLVYFEDMTYAQAAKIMKKTPKQIDNLLYRDKGDLRIILSKEDDLF